MFLTLIIEVKTLQYITYIPSKREMYVKNYRVNLTSFESYFINYLISNNGYCNISEFLIYMNNTMHKSIPKKSLVVEINRLRKRVVYQTGLPILKSRYGYGYILNY